MNIGMVGCGNIGEIHASILADQGRNVNTDPLLTLKAFADFDIKKASAFAERYRGGNAGTYASLEEMLESEDLQAVHICAPHYCHVPMAKTCLARNIHVLMEKPPAMSREEFASLKEAQNRSSAKLGIVFQNRYNPTTQVVDNLLRQGRIGKLNGARAFVTWHRDADYYTNSGWRGQLSTEGGGVLINQSIHTLDLLCRWMGACTNVKAVMQNHHHEGVIEVEDTLEAALTFGEKEALFYATTGYVEDAPVLLELHGTAGTIRIEADTVTLRTAEKECRIRTGINNVRGGKAYWGSGHEACIQDYYKCIETGRVFQNELLSVENTMDAMMRIYECCR